MATVHHLPLPTPPEDETVVGRFARLLKLEVELGLAETRSVVRSIVLAVGVGVSAAIALIASLVVLLAGAVAALSGVPWQPMVIAGGGVALLSLTALGWSVWRLTHVSWPTETLKSFEENRRWLAAQLRSRLTLRSPAA
jgi:hypothetical protein